MIGERDAAGGPDPEPGRCLIVDAHCHLWDLADVSRSWPDAPASLMRSFTAVDLGDAARKAGIAAAVLVESGTSEADAARLRANADASALIGAYVAFLDPFGPTPPEVVLDREAASPKFRGVRLRFEGGGAETPTEAAVTRAVEAVARRELVAELLVGAEHLPSVRRLLRDAEQVHPRVILDHLAKPDLRSGRGADRWRSEIAALAAETDACLKLSVSPRVEDIPWLTERGEGGWSADVVRPYAQHALAAFGAGRCAWGSDWPVGVFGGPPGEALAVMRDALGPLDPAATAAVYGGAAALLYRLPLPSTVDRMP